MTNYGELIGREVISVDAGLGRVIGFDDLGMGDNEFLVIEYGKDRAKSYFNTSAKQNFREITAIDEFKALINEIQAEDVQRTFESKQERINYFKGQAKTADIRSLFNLLKLLNLQDDLGTVEVQIQNRILDSVALEYSVINSVPVDEARTEIEGLF